MVATTWFSISGPANLPKDIAEKVNHEITRAVATPDVQARLQRDGLITRSCRSMSSKYIDFETVSPDSSSSEIARDVGEAGSSQSCRCRSRMMSVAVSPS